MSFDFSASGYINPVASGYMLTGVSGDDSVVSFYYPSGFKPMVSCDGTSTSAFCRVNSLGACTFPSGLSFEVSGLLPCPIGQGPFILNNVVFTDTLMVWQSAPIHGSNNYDFLISGVFSAPCGPTIKNWYYGTVNIDEGFGLGGAFTGCIPAPNMCQTWCYENGLVNPTNVQFIADLDNCIMGNAADELGNADFYGHWTLTFNRFINSNVPASGCEWNGYLDFDVDSTKWGPDGAQVTGDKIYRNSAFAVTTANGTILPSGSCLNETGMPSGNTAILYCSGFNIGLWQDDSRGSYTVLPLGENDSITTNSLQYWNYLSYLPPFWPQFGGLTCINISAQYQDYYRSGISGSQWRIHAL